MKKTINKILFTLAEDCVKSTKIQMYSLNKDIWYGAQKAPCHKKYDESDFEFFLNKLFKEAKYTVFTRTENLIKKTHYLFLIEDNWYEITNASFLHVVKDYLMNFEHIAIDTLLKKA